MDLAIAGKLSEHRPQDIRLTMRETRRIPGRTSTLRVETMSSPPGTPRERSDR